MIYKAKKGDHLLQSIAKTNSSFDASCGGKGTCGKCKIMLAEGILPVTEIEKQKLTCDEIKAGIRLACLHSICEEDCSFMLMNEQQGFVISGNEVYEYENKKEQGYAIAVDIGTTTVVMDLIHLETGKIEKEIRFLNPQRIYGSDVITRIEKVMNIGVEPLHKVLITKIEEALHSFKCNDIKRMCVCGNATMTHIFMNEEPTSIGQAPYLCKINEYKEIDSNELFDYDYTFLVQVLPPISAFVGSDIVMDIYETQLLKKENTMLIDLGTNGEIALVKDHHLYVSSAACGPAFEGGNMTYGIGASNGAVNHVFYDKQWKYTTINHQEAIGICGSGYMSWIASALRNSFIEESGWMEKDIRIDDQVILTQKDIREFQLAKSAIASACEVICNKANITYDELNQLLISGGFGKHIQPEDLTILGIIPKTLQSRLFALGNSAIRGCGRYAIMQDRDTIDSIIKNSETLSLASESLFSEKFMMNMIFDIN